MFYPNHVRLEGGTSRPRGITQVSSWKHHVCFVPNFPIYYLCRGFVQHVLLSYILEVRVLCSGWLHRAPQGRSHLTYYVHCYHGINVTHTLLRRNNHTNDYARKIWFSRDEVASSLTSPASRILVEAQFVATLKEPSSNDCTKGPAQPPAPPEGKKKGAAAPPPVDIIVRVSANEQPK